MNDMISKKIAYSLISPLFLFLVIVMVINDHVLKGGGLLHQGVTGKLSDFAFIFFVPIVVAYIFRVKTTRGLIISYLTVGGSFVAININSHCSQLVESIFAMAFIPLYLWPDPTDLIALTMIPCSILFVLRKKKPRPFQTSNYMQIAIAVVCVCACGATSPRHRYLPRPVPATYEPIYMSWEDFRTIPIETLPPRNIIKRGKIYIKDDYLYICDPGRGIHIYDNNDPKNPIAKCFLKIPGNTDISIKGRYLYADSYVDMVIYALASQPQETVLVNRLEDIFPYDPYQHQSGLRGYSPIGIDKKKGIIIGWRTIQSRSKKQ